MTRFIFLPYAVSHTLAANTCGLILSLYQLVFRTKVKNGIHLERSYRNPDRYNNTIFYAAKQDKAKGSPGGAAFLVSAGGREFLLELRDFLLGGVFGLIPALGRHLLIDGVPHGKGFVKGAGKGLLHVCCAGFHGAVGIEVDHALGGEEKILHDASVVHAHPPYTRL